MSTLEYIEIKPLLPATHSIIWLHGLGADGHDFSGIVPELNLPSEMAVRFILPHAPLRPISINNGMTMRGWYDIYGISVPMREDHEGIQSALKLIYKLIDQEQEAGIPYEHIFLAGFSQGGALALYSGLCFNKKLAGIIALSSYLPLADRIFKEVSVENKAIPIFMAHGIYDAVIPLFFGQGSCQILKAQGYEVDWHTYNMQHAVCPEEIHDISRWLQGRIQPVKV